MDTQPRNFTVALDAQITDDTQLYSQVLGGAAPIDDYKLTVGQIRLFLEALGFSSAAVVSQGIYASDSAAEIGGVEIGEYYELTITNDYGIPVGNGGLLKRRKE